MYEEENRCRLRETVVNAEEYLKMRDKKLKVENELRCFKSDFAKMVLAKEEALSQLARPNKFLMNWKQRWIRRAWMILIMEMNILFLWSWTSYMS